MSNEAGQPKRPRRQLRAPAWIAISLALLAVSTAVFVIAAGIPFATAIQASGSAVLVIVTVTYVVATHELVRLERERRGNEVMLRRVESARNTRKALWELNRHLDEIAVLTTADRVEESLRVIRNPEIARVIKRARRNIEEVWDRHSATVDTAIAGDYAPETVTAAEWAENWLNLLDRIRFSRATDIDALLAEPAPYGRGSATWFRGDAYDGKPALTDSEGIRTGKWARTAAQAVFNSYDALTTYIEESSLK